MRLTALLLDLDGTLVDTAPDMVGALNRLLLNHSKPQVDYAPASKQVSNGARALVRFGFGEHLEPTIEEQFIEEFLMLYARHVCQDSKLYDGILDCLEFVESKKIPWGVITNKPLLLAKDVLAGLGLNERCKLLLGGDSLPVKKPDPVPLLHSAMLLGLAPSECLYVGDHARDIQAARAAGMDSAAAAWGYLADGEDPASWQPDYIFNSPTRLHDFLKEKLVAHSH